MPHKPSLLLIAHTYAIDEHAKKLPELARHFELTCATVSRKSWGKHYGLDATCFGENAVKSGYTYVELEALGNVNSVTGFILKGLAGLIRSREWDMVLVENEPWSLLKWQTLFATRCARVRRYGEFTWENVLRRGWKGAILSRIYQLTAKWADFWICGNQAAARIVQEYGMPPSRVLVSPQVGVDTQHYQPAPADQRHQQRASLGLPLKAMIVGFAGRLVEEKGVMDLYQAMAALNDHAEENEPLHLAFMGHGSLSVKLKELAVREKWLRVYDAVPHHELPSFLQCLDVLVLGSHPVHNASTCWEEQFGHILIEAIACGVATLGSKSGAIPEVLADADLTFPPGDVLAIQDLLLQLKNDPVLLQAKREQLMSRVQDHYTHAAVADAWGRFLISQLS